MHKKIIFNDQRRMIFRTCLTVCIILEHEDEDTKRLYKSVYQTMHICLYMHNTLSVVITPLKTSNSV